MWDDNLWVPTNVSQPGSGLHKRIASIQVLNQIPGPQLDHICAIFCGTWKRIDKMAYPDNVRVYWQKKAWADGNFFREWEWNKKQLFQISIA